MLDNPDNKKETLVFGTIKLPEILNAMEEKDFREITKNKQAEFKKGLDQTSNEQNEVLFMGMSDREILLNQNEFKELGLL